MFSSEKRYKLTPEEIVRQLYLLKLNKEYGYSLDNNIELEYGVKTGSSSKRVVEIAIEDNEAVAMGYIREHK